MSNVTHIRSMSPERRNSSSLPTPFIFLPEELKKNLTESCARALNESRLDPERTLPESYCEGVFDEWSCWNDTAAGHMANQTCPEFIPGFDPNRYAYKQCMDNGTWFMIDGKPWTNYLTCVNMDDLNWQQTVTAVYKAGYLISLVALIVSLGLFSYLRSIRCARIILHMNLFASFAVNNAMWLIWYRILDTISVVSEAPVACQILHVFLHYFLLSNYAWMLCEGIYLHTVLVSAFISESSLLRWLHLFGWGFPIVFIIPYTALSVNTQEWSVACWTDSGDSPFKWVLTMPVVASIVLNLLFLFNIVRVLLVKLRAGPHMQLAANRPSQTALQALRATLLLVPLLGLNFLVTPFRPPEGHPLVKVYDIISAMTASFQGLCVTIIFCFCNGEVISQVKRKWKYIVFRPRTNSFTATTVSYVAGEKKINVKKHDASSNQDQINSTIYHENNSNKVNV